MKTLLETNLTRTEALGWMSLFQFLSDLTIALYIYKTFKSSEIQFFLGQNIQEIQGPNFQGQLFKLMLMGLHFLLLVFIITQFILYLYSNLTYSKAAFLYFKIYAVFGFTVSLYLTYYFSGYAIINMMIYLLGYYIFAREIKLIKEQGQNPSLLTKLLPKK